MSDLSLRKTILEELEFVPEIDAANIGVAVDNGVVTLSGHVSSYTQKISAERAVKGIKGVRALADEIQVSLPAELRGFAGELIAFGFLGAHAQQSHSRAGITEHLA